MVKVTIIAPDIPLVKVFLNCGYVTIVKIWSLFHGRRMLLFIVPTCCMDKPVGGCIRTCLVSSLLEAIMFELLA